MGMPAKSGEAAKWTVIELGSYASDANRLGLTESQKSHVIDVFLRLAEGDNPLQCGGVEIKHLAMGNGSIAYTLRDRNGILKQIEITAFFALDRAAQSIVLLGLTDHPHSQSLPYWMKLSIEVRWQQYENRNG